MSGTEAHDATPGRSRKQRRPLGLILLRGVIVAASAFVALGVAAAAVISHTDAGRGLALDWALERVRPVLNGTLTIGGVGPSGLLAGATLYEVELSDAMGRRVLAADSIRARYSIAELFGGPPAIADLHIWSPVVHMEPEPGEPVRLSELLAEVETEANAAAAEADEAGSPLFRIRGATIHDGVVVIRDSSGAEERVEGIEAAFSRVDIGPDEDPGLVAEVDAVALSYPLGYGRLELSDLRGEVEVGPDAVVVLAERFRLPGSEASGSMHIDLRDDDRPTAFDLNISRAALEDLSWLDERLDHGVASGAVRIRIDGGDVHVDVPEARARLNGGDFAFSGGLSATGTMRFRSLRVVPEMLSTAELEPWLPDALPVTGLLSGDVVFDGEPGRLGVTGSLALLDPASGDTLAGATGRGTVLDGGTLEETEVAFASLEYGLLARFLPWVWWEGRGSLDLAVDGNLATGMELHIAADHRSMYGGPRSNIVLDGFLYGDTAVSVVDLDATMSPLDLAIVRELRPDFPLTGPVGGSVSLTGPLERLEVAAELETTAGPLSAEGYFNAPDPAAGYRLLASAEDLRLSEWFAELPDSTVVTATARLTGQGLDLESLRGSLVANVGRSTIGGLRVDTAGVNLWVDEDGLMHVETLYAEAGGVVARSRGGSIGVTPGVFGEGVALAVSSPSIQPLRPLFMGENLVAWDELSSIEQDVMIEFDGVDPDTFPRAHEIRFDGTVDGDVQLLGWLADLEAEATVALGGFEYGPSSAAAVEVDLTAGGLSLLGSDTSRGSAPLLLEGAVTADSIVIEGREFRSGRMDGRFALGEGGSLHTLLRRSEEESYEAQAVVRLEEGGGRVDLDRLNLVFPERRWGLQGPASLEWTPDSVVVNDFSLIRPGADGLRLFADGRLVRGEGESDFDLEATDLDLGVVSRVLQLDEPLAGVASVGLFASGTAEKPVWDGSVRLGSAVYQTLGFDSVTATGTYSDGALSSQIESWSAGRRSLRIDGRVPMDLRLAAVEDRMPDEPRRIEIVADAFPAAMVLPALTGLDEVDGTISGTVTIAGTRSIPQPDGHVRLENATGFLEALGVRLASVNADARLSPDGTVVVAGTGASGEGTMRVGGTVDASQPDDFLLDLAFWPREFQIIDRRDMEIAVSGDSITLGGSFNYPLIQGRLEANGGTVFLEEFQRASEAIDFYDPVLFSAATEAFGFEGQETNDGTVTPRNPFLQNLRVLVDLHVGPGNWLRSRDMNVETTGDLSATFDRQGNQLILHGGIDVVRGSYSLGPRTLRMADGTFQFVGTPGFNPGIALTAETGMHTREGEPLVITADISGTLLSPRLTLSSDADAISDADLPSYILFGRPASALIGEGGAASVGAGRNLLLGQVFNQFGYLLALELDVDHLSVSQAEQSQANAAFGASSLQVEVGWYIGENVFLTGVYQRAFCADPTLPVGSGGMRVEVGMPQDVKLEGFLEGRCTRERYRGLGDLSLKLSRIWGFSLFREWGY